MDFKKIWAKVLVGLKWFFHSYIWLFVLFLVIDLVTKIVIVNYFATHDSSIVLLGSVSKPFLQISYAINERAAFGFGLESAIANRIIYCIVASVGTAALITIYVFSFKKTNSFVKACLMLMLVGALGNLIDRIFYTPSFLHAPNNGVVDWIDFIGIWPFIFNIADSCVVVGTIMLIVYFIIDEIKTVRAKRAEEVKESGGKVLSKEEQQRLEAEEAPIEEEKGEDSADE